MRDEYAKLAQENQTLKATIQSYERYYNEQRVNNYKKKKKKRDIINPIVKLKMNFSFPKKERKIKFILMM